ncbi:TIGR03085 family protein [Actinomadura barringtoniae]|uniref:TIGR03085 family protein n=1 Tax=Actinomadura barringtoniae TaxID=1427535 RepID=A0A939T4T1_9ACTN|nr:TIGR03085 family metal-binding protein [Actinomadura barringtoniae]MBO2449783.1 TIGR03085 family protein [Actinomadura barringtoniae]
MNLAQQVARSERAALCDALTEAGPDAPTGCTGWTTADLAAHLVVRETRADTWPGLVLSPLGSYTERVRRKTARTESFERLVERLREGPPRFSPYALPGGDGIFNLVEFFVHHEDVRRARPEWEPRSLESATEEVLWRKMKIARFVMRNSPVEVTLVRPDGRSRLVARGGKRRPGAVRVHGPVAELLLWTLGRTPLARVRLTGPPEAVKTLTETGWSL